MNPDRQCVVGGHKIDEYYWAGEMVVYVDGRASGMPYDMACEHYRALTDKPAPADYSTVLVNQPTTTMVEAGVIELAGIVHSDRVNMHAKVRAIWSAMSAAERQS